MRVEDEKKQYHPLGHERRNIEMWNRLKMNDSINWPIAPCEDSLKGMPGDSICFYNGTEQKTDVIESAGWQPTPNGGKVWCYKTVYEDIVPNTSVYKIEKCVPPAAVKRTFKGEEIEAIESLDPIREEMPIDPYGYQTLMMAAMACDIPMQFKTAISLIVDGDWKSLEVAAFLISQRSKQLKELDSVKNSVMSFDSSKQQP